MTVHAHLRLGRSVRSYRRWLEQVMREFYFGRRTPGEAQAAQALAKAATELFMTEHMLAQTGADQEVEQHPLGPDGGYEGPQRGSFGGKKAKVKVQKGMTAKGPVDTRTVEIEAAGMSPEEIDDEIAKLL